MRDSDGFGVGRSELEDVVGNTVMNVLLALLYIIRSGASPRCYNLYHTELISKSTSYRTSLIGFSFSNAYMHKRICLFISFLFPFYFLIFFHTFSLPSFPYFRAFSATRYRLPKTCSLLWLYTYIHSHNRTPPQPKEHAPIFPSYLSVRIRRLTVLSVCTVTC